MVFMWNKKHSGKPQSETHMKDFCPARGNTCEYCSGTNHFTKCCRKKKTDKKRADKKGEVKTVKTQEDKLKRLREAVKTPGLLALKDQSTPGNTNNLLTAGQ